MLAHLECLSHTPLLGHHDPAQNLLDEVFAVQKAARERIAAFKPDLIVLFTPDHFNGFFYNVMPSFCIGTGAHAIGDFDSLAGRLDVPFELATQCATHSAVQTASPAARLRGGCRSVLGRAAPGGVHRLGSGLVADCL